MVMQWSGSEQIRLFAQSILLGICFGVLFSFFNVASKPRNCRHLLFLGDMLFFVTTSFITFFFAMTMMDGRLHPLLFGGSLVGFVLFHVAFGRYLSRWLYRFGRWLMFVMKRLIGLILTPFRLMFLVAQRAFNSIYGKRKKKAENTRKKSAFFQKKS